MSGDYAWDSNIAIAYFKSEVSILTKMKSVNSISIPATVLGELYYGAEKSQQAVSNIQRVDQFRDQNVILQCDAGTAAIYGSIRNALRLKGKPIPENDIWIAALTIQHDLTLVTRDAHFGEISTLQREAW